MKEKRTKIIFSRIRVLIDYIFSALIIAFSPVASISRRIGLNRLPHTKKNLSRIGIDFIWSTYKDPVDEDLLKSNSVSIVFQGGLGAQIISASIYLYLSNQGYKTYADFSYFKNEFYLASLGEGRCSQWDYRLDGYELPMTAFKNFNECTDDNVLLIHDGVLKTQLFQKAIADPEVRKYFPISKPNEKFNSVNFFKFHDVEPYSYICIHIRRGDYMNSDVHHIVPENNFLEIAEKFIKLSSTIVITSDSRLSQEFKSNVKKKFSRVVFLDDMAIDDLATHSVMRLASVLICSNSQFSMTAGLLSEGLAFIPTKFFEGAHQQDLARVIYEKYAKFSLLNL